MKQRFLLRSLHGSASLYSPQDVDHTRPQDFSDHRSSSGPIARTQPSGCEVVPRYARAAGWASTCEMVLRLHEVLLQCRKQACATTRAGHIVLIGCVGLRLHHLISMSGRLVAGRRHALRRSTQLGANRWQQQRKTRCRPTLAGPPRCRPSRNPCQPGPVSAPLWDSQARARCQIWSAWWCVETAR
jgi:hypothetical protein